MSLTYQKIHWGIPPTQIQTMRVWDYTTQKAAIVGKCASISYRTQKAGKWSTYEHTFERRPSLIVPDRKGSRIACARAIPDDMIAIGWVVDMVLEGGQRVSAPGYVVATNKTGSSVWIAAVGAQPAIAIEQMAIGPIVTEHGIEK